MGSLLNRCITNIKISLKLNYLHKSQLSVLFLPCPRNLINSGMLVMQEFIHCNLIHYMFLVGLSPTFHYYSL
jgi:hypothetical protein